MLRTDGESHERLLSEEEEACPCTETEKVSKKMLHQSRPILRYVIAAGVLFCLIGGFFGYHWYGDINAFCIRHVSQYCEIAPDNPYLKPLLTSGQPLCWTMLRLRTMSKDSTVRCSRKISSGKVQAQRSMQHGNLWESIVRISFPIERKSSSQSVTQF
jgi:hypothetical protein